MLLTKKQAGTHRRSNTAGWTAGWLAWLSQPASAKALPASSNIIDAALGSAAVALLASLMMFASLVATSRRDGMAASWLALTCGCLGLAVLFATHSVAGLLPGMDGLGAVRLGGLSAAALTWALTALAIKHWRMFGPLPERQLHWLLALTAVVSIAALVWPLLAAPVVSWWLIAGGWGLFPALRAALARHRFGAPALLAGLLLMAGVGADLSTFLTSGQASPSALAAIGGFAFLHTSILVRQFIRDQRMASKLSANLVDEVERRTRELQRKNDRLEQAQAALRCANEALRELSITDGLTHLYNRTHFEQCLAQEWRRCARQGGVLSVLMIDADHFKALNDSAGHLVGDRCLQTIAAELKRQFRRAGEIVARYGGEEFVVLLPETGHAAALAIAEGVRAAVANLTLPDAGRTVTVSIGVSTTAPSAEQRVEQLLGAADAALYKAKDGGRNRVHSMPLIGGRPAAAQRASI